jgi:cytochrome c oxidase subunit III
MSHAFQESLKIGQVIDVEPEVGRSGDGRIFPPNTLAGRPLPQVVDPAGEPVRTGVWIFLATISMMCAAFTSAAVVREGSANDWEHIVLPNILYLNTAVLLISSVTLEIARRSVLAYAQGQIRSPKVPLVWLSATFAFRLIFVLGQLVAWCQLKAQGVYLASSPTSSFFYVMTAFHAVLVVGGLGGLGTRDVESEGLHGAAVVPSTAPPTIVHFMGVLWAYLLLLLWLRF